MHMANFAKALPAQLSLGTEPLIAFNSYFYTPDVKPTATNKGHKEDPCEYW